MGHYNKTIDMRVYTEARKKIQEGTPVLEAYRPILNGMFKSNNGRVVLESRGAVGEIPQLNHQWVQANARKVAALVFAMAQQVGGDTDFVNFSEIPQEEQDAAIVKQAGKATRKKKIIEVGATAPEEPTE